MRTSTFSNRNKRGSSTALALSFVLGFSVLGLGVLSVTSGQQVNAAKATDKFQADALAESANQVYFDQIRRMMISDLSYPFRLNKQDVVMPIDGRDTVIGNQAAKLIAHREVQTDMKVGGKDIRRHTHTFTLEGTGQTARGTESVIRATFTGTFDREIVARQTVIQKAAPPESFYFPAGAIVSNDRIQITTNQGLRTYSPNGQDAHVIANDGIKWDPKSGLKKDFDNPNVLDIQGNYLVPQGGVWQRTQEAGWLGNPNGKKNYRSPAIAKSGNFAGVAADTVVAMPGAIDFANEATVAKWATNWKARATGPDANQFTKSVDSATHPQRAGDQWRIIQSPAYIDGDLLVRQGQQIRLMPNSTNPKDNVVYVRGNVQNVGQLLNLGVTLVFEGKYSDGPGAEYKIDTQGSPFQTREMVLMRSNFISLNKSANAITWTTSSSTTSGLIYAANGGIKVESSNAEITGMLLAGGKGQTGGINIEPGGGASFVVKYDPYAATGGNLNLDELTKINTEMVPGNVTRPFTPTKMFNWVHRK